MYVCVLIVCTSDACFPYSACTAAAVASMCRCMRSRRRCRQAARFRPPAHAGTHIDACRNSSADDDVEEASKQNEKKKKKGNGAGSVAAELPRTHHVYGQRRLLWHRPGSTVCPRLPTGLWSRGVDQPKVAGCCTAVQKGIRACQRPVKSGRACKASVEVVRCVGDCISELSADGLPLTGDDSRQQIQGAARRGRPRRIQVRIEGRARQRNVMDSSDGRQRHRDRGQGQAPFPPWKGSGRQGSRRCLRVRCVETWWRRWASVDPTLGDVHNLGSWRGGDDRAVCGARTWRRQSRGYRAWRHRARPTSTRGVTSHWSRQIGSVCSFRKIESANEEH